MFANFLVLPDPIQVIHNFFRLTMTEEYLSVGKHDADTGIAPNIGTLLSNAANAVTAKETPGRNSIGLDVLQRNGAETKAEGADLDSVGGETIMKTTPGQSCGAQKQHCRQCHHQSQAGLRDDCDHHQLNSCENDEDQSPKRSRVDFLGLDYFRVPR